MFLERRGAGMGGRETEETGVSQKHDDQLWKNKIHP